MNVFGIEIKIGLFFQLLLVFIFSCQVLEAQNNEQAITPIESKGFIPEDNGKTRYFFKDGMMWERGARAHDNLWRTSIAYIAYGDPKLKKGMLDCIKWETPDKIRYYRSTYQEDEDVSRDQVTMFLVAMALQGEDVKKYVKATKWRLSKRFTLTIDMWLWMQAISGNKLAGKLFNLIEMPVVKTYYLLNISNLTKRKFPAYAIHLLAWQLYAVDDESPMHSKICSMVNKMADDDNYLVKMLIGEQVSMEEINSVVPITDFQWQRGKHDTNLYLRPLTKDEAEYNLISIDILNAIYNQTHCIDETIIDPE